MLMTFESESEIHIAHIPAPRDNFTLWTSHAMLTEEHSSLFHASEEKFKKTSSARTTQKCSLIQMARATAYTMTFKTWGHNQQDLSDGEPATVHLEDSENTKVHLEA